MLNIKTSWMISAYKSNEKGWIRGHLINTKAVILRAFYKGSPYEIVLHSLSMSLIRIQWI